MSTNKEDIKQVLETIQTCLGDTIRLEYESPNTVDAHDWDYLETKSLSKQDCRCLSIYFARLAELLEFNDEHK